MPNLTLETLLFQQCRIVEYENALGEAREVMRRLQQRIDELEPPPPPRRLTPAPAPPETLLQRTLRLFNAMKKWQRRRHKPRGASMRVWRLLLSED